MSPTPKRFVTVNGVNQLNPEYIAWKKNGGTKTRPQPNEAPISKMVLHIEVLQGSDLVAKDRNLFGKKTTSDPYVKVQLLCHPEPSTRKKPQTLTLGRTPTVKKNLSPVWNHSVRPAIPYNRRSESLRLAFQIFDEDVLSSDDSMGVVTLPPLEWKNSTGAPTWYEIPKGSAKSVSGKIQIRIQTHLHRVQGLKPYC